MPSELQLEFADRRLHGHDGSSEPTLSIANICGLIERRNHGWRHARISED